MSKNVSLLDYVDARQQISGLLSDLAFGDAPVAQLASDTGNAYRTIRAWRKESSPAAARLHS